MKRSSHPGMNRLPEGFPPDMKESLDDFQEELNSLKTCLMQDVRPGTVVYICSRFGGDSEDEVDYNECFARLFCWQALLVRAIPVTPHFLFPRHLLVKNAEGWNTVIQCTRRLLMQCRELWVFDLDGLSDGMREEIEWANTLGLRIRHIHFSI